MGVGDHPTHDGRRGPRRRILHRPALEPHGLPHGCRIHHPPLRRVDAEDVHLSVPLHLALHHRSLSLPHRQDHRGHGRHSAQHEYPAAGGFQHPLRHDRRPARRRGDRRVAVPHPVRRRHHRHSAVADEGRRNRSFPRQGPGGIFQTVSGDYTWVFIIAFMFYNLFFLGGNWAYVQRYTSVSTPRNARKVGWLFGILYLVSPILWMLPADDLPRLQPRPRRAGSRECLSADVQGGDALGSAEPDARRHDLRHGQFA